MSAQVRKSLHVVVELGLDHGSRSSARWWAPWFKPMVPGVAAALSVPTTTTATATGATAASRNTSTESSELRQCEAAADHRRRREQVFAGGKDNLARAGCARAQEPCQVRIVK